MPCLFLKDLTSVSAITNVALFKDLPISETIDPPPPPIPITLIFGLNDSVISEGVFTLVSLSSFFILVFTLAFFTILFLFGLTLKILLNLILFFDFFVFIFKLTTNFFLTLFKITLFGFLLFLELLE